MKGKLISIGVAVIVLVLLLTLAPACGKEKGEVKTLSMGILVPLSGPAAPWGTQIASSVEWAADEVNAAGGIKVGSDRYMIRIVEADTKGIGSQAANELTRLIYDEGIHYVVGPLGYETSAIAPIAEEGNCFAGIIGNPLHPGPEFPHIFITACPPEVWEDTFWQQAYQFHPEIKTVAVLADTLAYSELVVAANLEIHPRYGREVVLVKRYEAFATDFYPVLTPVVAKNPDCIAFAGGAIGDIDLMVKQVRELGFTGLLAGGTHGDPQSTVDIAGPEYAEGFMVNDPDYDSGLYPESTRQLYAEFQERYPGQPFSLVSYLGYAVVNVYVQAMEKAGSIDPDEVMKVFDDPDWEFEWFGMSGRSFGGYETFGINRMVQDEVCYSEVLDGKKVMKGRQSVVIP